MKIVKMIIVEDNEDVEDGVDEDEDKDNWWQKLCSDKSYVVIKVKGQRFIVIKLREVKRSDGL